MSTGGFELRISCIQVLWIRLAYYALWPRGLGNYLICKRFAVQTLLWSLEFVIKINLKHKPIVVSTRIVFDTISNSKIHRGKCRPAGCDITGGNSEKMWAHRFLETKAEVPEACWKDIYWVRKTAKSNKRKRLFPT